MTGPMPPVRPAAPLAPSTPPPSIGASPPSALPAPGLAKCPKCGFAFRSLEGGEGGGASEAAKMSALFEHAPGAGMRAPAPPLPQGPMR